ncbi:MAG: 30S ribosomal protein S17 [Candidatus Moranbacteria bacterium CG10_big_fil_rev_8_21_14_0_10_35_21]|nr:MAG: 30S ribosomal protein S17 [Candidatus Moranbacteria bacterium CG10_big_fil_rev_8_21_14_0_10_35_21]PJA88777.1 MAG: 30S ribosomal protein S17 [Candidatus Moranbacteria bacterium CG_4_9_14_3_um_filter_36_9]
MTSQSSKNKIIVRKRGKVVSDKADKTVVVSIDSFKTHPMYKKKYKVTKKYKAHDPENRFKMGDLVEIIPCRPMSRDKRHKVIYPSTQNNQKIEN